MRKIPVIVALFLSLSIVGFAQNPPAMPDYSGWNKAEEASGKGKATLDQTDIDVSLEVYQQTDMQNLKRYSLNVLSKESGKPWLALYSLETGERQSDSRIRTASINIYLFEKTNTGWIFVKDFSNTQNLSTDVAEFLKEKYKLELK